MVGYDERFDYSGIASSHEDRHKQVANIKTAREDKWDREGIPHTHPIP